jgi:hypothetical protein
MQNQLALHCSAEAAGAKMKCRGSRRYTVMKKKQVLQSNAEVAGPTLNAEVAGATL